MSTCNGRLVPVLFLTLAFVSAAGVSAVGQTRPQGDELPGPNEAAKRQAEFYEPDEVQTIRLSVAEADLKRLTNALPDRIYVPASFQWRDVTIENVGLRFKGNSSSHPRQQHKRSFLIKFDKYKKGSRFFGLRRASLDNGVQFGSLFSEPIVTEILRDLKIPTHRCNYSKLFLNGEYQGVYVNVERIDDIFIRDHLPDPTGALFKVDEGGPGCNLQFLGDDETKYQRAFEPKNKTARKNAAQLVDLIRMINQTEPVDFARTLEANLAIDDFLQTTAVMLFSGAFDQLTGWQTHNYYLYRDGRSKRWHYLPWDLDVGFSETAFGRIKVLADWNAAWPVPTTGSWNPLLEGIIADPVLLARYRKSARTILDKYFEPTRLCSVIDAKYELIKEDLKDDPFPHRRVTSPGDRGYEGIVESLKDFVRKRHAVALKQLDDPGTRPKFVGPPTGSGRGRMPPEIARKIQLVQRAAQQMQRARRDVSGIQKLMSQLPRLIHEGKLDAADRVLAEAIKLLPKQQ